MSYCVYMLECNDKNNSLYTGITNNLDKRIAGHSKGNTKYTRGRLPIKLLWYMQLETKSLALKEEYRIKQLTRKQKLKLIQ